jgi:hypothetical protein
MLFSGFFAPPRAEPLERSGLMGSGLRFLFLGSGWGGGLSYGRRLGLGGSFVAVRILDIILDIAQTPFEVPNGFSHGAAQLRQPAGAENDEDDDENHEDLAPSEIAETEETRGEQGGSQCWHGPFLFPSGAFAPGVVALGDPPFPVARSARKASAEAIA